MIEKQYSDLVDVGQAEKILNDYRLDSSDNDDILDMLKVLLAALLVEGKTLCGSADDFHNFAVTVSKLCSDNKTSYAIVREGLKIHSANTDLLADALLYGYDAGELDACTSYYKQLLTVDKSCWTWRAFSFSINYLLKLYGSQDEHAPTMDDILALAIDYQNYRSDLEDAWLALYRIYNETNQKAKAVGVLEDANQKFRYCPKCWLRYADIMMDRGDYEKAAPIIRKILRNPKSTEDINTSYMYYLDGLCKLQMLMDTDEYEVGTVDEGKVKIIYRSFHLARNSQGLRETTSRQIQEYIERLEVETGIEYDY